MAGSQGAGVRSIRPFQSSEQYLYAMKEDMAEWLRDLYELEISAETFLEVLETGSVLCLHANNITRVAGEFRAEYPALAERVHLPRARVSVNRMAQPGTFQARDNVSNFIQWCRREMSITDVLMFETDDLVLRKNEKNFVLCLLELARRASRFGMSAPVLIQMEEQIEEEIREEMELPPEEIPIPKPQRRPCDFKNLDQMVQHLVSRCTCPDQFSMIKVSEGKYRVGDSSTLIFVRILRNHVMVRVGGGWDTLEHYLDKHDPCRCTSLSHKQAIKLGGTQKQIAPVHELRTRLPPKTESGNNLHPTLIVRRSQSPLPPVEWRTYNPGMSSVKTQPSTSLEGSERTSGFRTPQEQSDTKRCTLTRSLDRPATPSQRKLFVEDRSSSKQITSPRSARDHFSSSTLSLASQLTESEGGSSSRSSDVSIETQRGRQAGRPTVTNQKEQSAKSNRLSKTMPQLGTSRDTTPQTVAGAQRSSTSQERSGRSLSPTKQLHNSSRPHVKGAEQKHHSQSESVAKVSLGPMSQRPPTPMKSITSLSKQDLNRKNQFQEDTMSMRSSMQRKSDVAEPRVENGEIHNAEAAKAQLQQMLMTKAKVGSSAIDQIEDHSLNTVQNIIKKVARPHLDIGLGTMRCDTVWEDESTEQNNTSSQDLTDKGEREGAYTPLPINQEQEQELYRSLEDEILSNIKELEGDSDENNQSENRLGDFSRDHSIANDTAVHDFSALSSASSFPSTLKSAGEGVVVPRSGVYINTKWQAEASYDNVVLELSKGPKKLNRVDVENWIAKIPPKTEVDFVKEPHAPVPNGTEEKTEPLKKERTYTRRKTSNSELKGTKLRRVPSQRIRGGVKEVSRSQQVLSDGQASSTNSAPQESDSDKSKPLQVNKPRRSLKKPERVPSIYKLKLRPKIRPRRDNRPEKQPSKIPTPMMYRQETNPVNTKASKNSQPGQTSGCQSRAPQGNPSKRLERSLAQSSENLASDEEAWMSDQSNSPHSKSAVSKSLQERSQPEGEVDDEESWV